jgi:hypothetical protein
MDASNRGAAQCVLRSAWPPHPSPSALPSSPCGAHSQKTVAVAAAVCRTGGLGLLVCCTVSHLFVGAVRLVPHRAHLEGAVLLRWPPINNKESEK